MGKHLLVVAHHFPPYPGIGGRRWAKFAKYLAQKGYVVHVICAPNPGSEESTWTKDVQHPNIFTYPIPDNYPKIAPASTVAGKIINRAKLAWLWLRAKGSPFDVGVFWGEGMLAQARLLISAHDIDWVVVTGAPFHTMFDVISLKNEYPALKVLCDYRDQWTNGWHYGMRDISAKRLAHEKEKEAMVISKADVVTAPSSEDVFAGHFMGEHIAKNLVILPHAYDPDDLPGIQESPLRADNSPITLIYGGVLYEGAEVALQNLRTCLDAWQKNAPMFYGRLHIVFYTHAPVLSALFSGHPLVTFQKPIAAKPFLEQVSRAHISMLFPNGLNKNSKTTKFVEYLAIGNPFLLLGELGELSAYIATEKIGEVFAPDSIEANSLQEAILRLASMPPIPPERRTSYSFGTITDRLIELFA